MFRVFKFLGLNSKIRIFSITLSRALLSFLDLAGIALIGLFAMLAVSPSGTTKHFELGSTNIDISNSSRDISFLALLTFLIFILRATGSLILIRINYKNLSVIDGMMSAKVAKAFFFSTYEEIRTTPKSTVQWSLLFSVRQAFSTTLNSLMNLAVDTFSMLLMFIFLFVVDPLASIVAFLYFGSLVFLVQVALSKKRTEIAKQQGHYYEKALVAIEDGYVAYKENFVQRLINRPIDKFRKASLNMSIQMGKVEFLSSIPKISSELALMLGILGFVSWQLLTGTLEQSIGIIAVFLAAGVKIMGVLSPIQGSLGTLKVAAVQGEEAYAYLSKDVMESSSEHPQPQFEVSPSSNADDVSGFAVTIQGASFVFPDSTKPVLNNISLKVSPGQYVALIGPSGAGKTTLIDMMLGLYNPSEGKVLIEGKTPEEIIQLQPGTISYVPQKPGLITGTLRQNITLDEPESEFDIPSFERAVSIAHLEELISSFPTGMEHNIDGSNANLSGGQIQRVGLARAIYSNPKLLILDEATSALDAETEDIINSALQALKPQVTIVVIAHRLSTVQKADNVFVLENGRVTDNGTFSYLRKTHPLVKDYVRLMSFEKND